MDTLKNPNVNNTIMSVLTAIIVTGFLFIILSNLTNFKKPSVSVDRPSQIWIDNKRPPEPLEPVIEEEIEPRQLEPEQVTRPENYQPAPQFIVPNSNPNTHGLKIPITPNINHPQAPVVPETFTPDQVDRKPMVIRSFPPVYPFSATNKGIEGRVVLRFMVDEDGMVQDPEVVHAEPEGVFEESALSAILKYRFKPALIGNKPVKCIVKLPIGFRLN